MGNMVFNRGEWSDAAVLTGGNEAPTLPVTMLQRPQPTQLWQSVGLSNLWIVGNVSPTRPWDCVALMYTNATSVATLRIRAATSQANLTTSPTFDTGVVTLWASPGLDPSWTRRHSFFIHTTTISQPWIRLDIADPTNPDTFFRAGRLLVGQAYRPSRNFQYGTQLGYLDDSVHTLTLGGQTVVRQGASRLTADFAVAFVPKAEAYSQMLMLDRAFGRKRPFLAVLSPEDTTHRHQEMVYGLMTDNQFLSVPAFNYHSHRFTLEEML